MDRNRAPAPSGDVAAFLDVAALSRLGVPLMVSSAACGFPSPAEDYVERPLDFNEFLVRNAAATFAVRIAGDSMVGAGLFPGDVAVVDRSVTPANGCVVLALLGGEFTVKRYRRTPRGVLLRPENPAYRDIVVPDDGTFEVWGVIGHSIRVLHP